VISVIVLSEGAVADINHGCISLSAMAIAVVGTGILVHEDAGWDNCFLWMLYG